MGLARAAIHAVPATTASNLLAMAALRHGRLKKGKGSPYLITERRVPELIPVLGSQPAVEVSHKPGGRLLLKLYYALA